MLTSSWAFLLSVWRQGRGTGETNKCSLSAWGVEGLSGQCWLAVGSLSAADIQICLLCWCFREFSRGFIEDLLLHHLHHLLLPLVIHPTVSCYQVYFPGNQLSWMVWYTGETASSLAAFHSIPLICNKIPYSSPNAKCGT